MSWRSANSRIRDLPPSAKLVVKALEYDGDDQTEAQLVTSTRMPKRTVRYALRELEEEGVVTSRPCLTDARKQVYSLREDFTTSGE